MGEEFVKYRIGKLAFTWDDDKYEANLRKHGVEFGVAAEVFFDNYALDFEDNSQGEPRHKIIGMTMKLVAVLFVVYTERATVNGENVFRIISARKATRKEREFYVKEANLHGTD